MLRIRQRFVAGTGMANGGRKEGKKTVARAAGRCASLAPFRPRGFAVGALRRSGPEKGRPSSPARPWGCPPGLRAHSLAKGGSLSRPPWLAAVRP